MIEPLFIVAGFSLFFGWTAGQVCLQILVSAINSLTPRDDSDPPKGQRSGMRIVTDHLTGVQYLKSSINGPLVPRLNSQGLPITIKDKV